MATSPFAPANGNNAPAGGGHEAALESGFKAAWAAVYDDSTLDDKAKVAKAREILAGRAKMLGKAPADDTSDSADDYASDDPKVQESRRAANVRRLRQIR